MNLFPEIRQDTFHIPNGGRRNKFEAYCLKRQGVTAGVPDIFMAIPSKGFHGLFVELKHGKNGLTDKQSSFLNRMEGRGYCRAVCYSLDDFINTVEGYLGE